jgi:hypothetical protein
MKRIISLFLATTMFVVACNNNKPKETTVITSPDGKETVTIDPQKMQNAVQDMEKLKTELEKLTPLTPDQLKALIPESLMGAKGTNFEATSAMGAGLARSEYELNDSTRISLNIYDCAGSAGAGIYSMQYLSMFNFQQESDEEYTRTIEFNGGKAFEHCEKATNDCTLSYFSGGRFLVTIEGDHVGAEALKQAAKGLNIK